MKRGGRPLQGRATRASILADYLPLKAGAAKPAAASARVAPVEAPEPEPYRKVEPEDDDSVNPFAYLPDLCGSRRLRGYPSWRWSDQAVGWATAEYRYRIWEEHTWRATPGALEVFRAIEEYKPMTFGVLLVVVVPGTGGQRDVIDDLVARLAIERPRIGLRVCNLVELEIPRERKEDHERHHDALDHHEGHGAPVDLARGHRLHALARKTVGIGHLGGHRAQEEQREAERRVARGHLCPRDSGRGGCLRADSRLRPAAARERS